MRPLNHDTLRAPGSRPSLRAGPRHDLPGAPQLQALPYPARQDFGGTPLSYRQQVARSPGSSRRGGLFARLLAPFTRRKRRIVRADPAPSRLSYRMHRLWLTPLFHRMLRLGLPAFAIVFAAGMLVGDGDRRAAIAEETQLLIRSIQERPEFMVSRLEVTGGSPELVAAVHERGPGQMPVSSFDLDLDALRADVEALDVVARAEVRIRSGGVLEVRVTERTPAIVWRSPSGLQLLDGEGHRIALLTHRAARADLPLIAGEGADRRVPEALEIFAAAGPLAPRLRGLVRMGERRWDVVLDRDQRILLPESGAVLALERVIALDHAQELLARDVVAVDMRNAARPTIRLATAAVEELRRIRGLERGGFGQ